jgi:predicted transposase YdaD
LEFNLFDVTTKELVWDGPTAWLERLGIGPLGPVELIDSDITALTASADKVINVAGEEPYLVNLELQSSHDKELVETTWFRQAALYRRHSLPVLTVLILLRREANSPSFTGSFEICTPDGWQTNRYNYRVVRMWTEDPESYLTSGINLVPLAPLTNLTEADLPSLVHRMEARISAEPRPVATKLWTATYLLMGLRYSDEVISHLLEGVLDMQESTTYQAILKQGQVAGEQKVLIRQGTKKFGKPDAGSLAAIEGIRELERLEALGERMLDAEVRDWKSLLGGL